MIKLKSKIVGGGRLKASNNNGSLIELIFVLEALNAFRYYYFLGGNAYATAGN